MNVPELREAILGELARIGLDLEAMPNLAADESAIGPFLEHLRSLPTGASWYDVFPDLTPSWTPPEPERWITAYRPLGPYDYQELPTGPAVHVDWPKEADAACLETLLRAARDAGWPIYGAGFLDTANPHWPTRDAMLVLTRGTNLESCMTFSTGSKRATTYGSRPCRDSATKSTADPVTIPIRAYSACFR